MVGVYVLEYQGALDVEPYIIRQAVDGTVNLPAAEADLQGGVQYEANKDCIGYWTNADAVVRWTFDLKTAGNYNLTVELACPDDAAGSEVQIEIGGDQVKFKVPATGDWAKFVKVDLGAFP